MNLQDSYATSHIFQFTTQIQRDEKTCVMSHGKSVLQFRQSPVVWAFSLLLFLSRKKLVICTSRVEFKRREHKRSGLERWPSSSQEYMQRIFSFYKNTGQICCFLVLECLYLFPPPRSKMYLKTKMIIVLELLNCAVEFPMSSERSPNLHPRFSIKSTLGQEKALVGQFLPQCMGQLPAAFHPFSRLWKLGARARARHTGEGATWLNLPPGLEWCSRSRSFC